MSAAHRAHGSERLTPLGYSLSAEREAIAKELLRLEAEHQLLRHKPGEPFDWDAHQRHIESLRAVSQRLRLFRDHLG